VDSAVSDAASPGVTPDASHGVTPGVTVDAPRPGGFARAASRGLDRLAGAPAPRYEPEPEEDLKPWQADLSRAPIATPEKITTTVAMDYGRITLDDDLVLYLFGTPGQERFWFMWDDLVRGAIGAIVLADTRRLTDCFPALDYFESCGLPYIVAVNEFDDSDRYEPEDVRDALTVPAHVPVMIMDARNRASVLETLLALCGHAISVSPE
jgi:signal recognition particle receptor subunit beta